MPVREPTGETGTFPMATITTGTDAGNFVFNTGPSYGPTSRTYKCSNPKCWVTKITESWE
jgi:hypothetical protein